MRSAARGIALALLFASGCDDAVSVCTDGVKHVSVDESQKSLDGDTPRERFDRAAGPWNCTVTWIAPPPGIATQEPDPGSSSLEMTLERTSDEARYREYALTPSEKWESTRCQTDAMFVPCSLGLASEDGALDETLDCELRLQGENTYIHVVVTGYEFAGDHTLTFAGEVERAAVEFGVVYTPGDEPTRIDGSIVESGVRKGTDPLVTTARIECARL
jgi:hypothetical protein